jgi:Nucleoside-diphosphate-sugar pyrophosphorylase involved in lipopolysaccharide biosynthesis/translation initiation factor 2B, gamma/epsilon subunits (eIF-2Bgamma/eIF-2Bepsilon)
MLPVGDQPLLGHIVEALATAGLDEIICVVGHNRERIQTYLENGTEWGVDIEYVTQGRPRGTGDALLQAEHAVSDSSLVINGDRLVEPSLIERLHTAYTESGAAQLAITEVANPNQYGVVTVDGDQLTDIIEKPAPHESNSRLVNAGVYALSPDIFAAIRQTETHGELKLTDTLEQYLAAHPVQTVRYDGLWVELSHPWDLLTASSEVLADQSPTTAASTSISNAATVGSPVAIGAHSRVQPGARLLRDVVVGDNVSIGANSVLSNSIVFEDAVIKPGTVLTDCIVGAGATIGPLTTAEGGTTDVRVDTTIHQT